MHCEPLFNPQSKRLVGHICGGQPSRAKCQFCGSRCDYECDFPVGKKVCDKKICHQCAQHFPLLDPISDQLAVRDSKDFCPTHRDFAFPVGSHFIFVVNSDFSLDAKAILIDRSTPLGNPYRLQKDDPYLRQECIRKYKRWLWENIKLPTSIPMTELKRLVALATAQDLVLRCWCAPKPCHGQVVAAALQWMAQNTKELGGDAAKEYVKDAS